ncbi:MAG TPA: IPT/TIG domain-containing protein, partial [Dehalococcoidia bacterium]|nr:IPT/TIG domain-containing protein [Dehalococcoidia bacterium]
MADKKFRIPRSLSLAVVVLGAATLGALFVLPYLRPGYPTTVFSQPSTQPAAALAVISVAPNSGPISGGTPVTITVTDAGTGAATVTFGGVPATNVNLDGDTITATTPAHTAGAVSVVVTNPNSESGTLSNGFTFNPEPGPVNVLQNASFDSDADNNNQPDVWTSSKKFTRSGAIAPYHGTYIGRFYATDNTGVTITQTVSVNAGTTYSFSCQANIPATADSFTFKFQVRWLKADDTVITTSTIKTYTDDTNGAWNQATGNRVAPVGAVKARIRMVASSLNGTIYV